MCIAVLISASALLEMAPNALSQGCATGLGGAIQLAVDAQGTPLPTDSNGNFLGYCNETFFVQAVEVFNGFNTCQAINGNTWLVYPDNHAEQAMSGFSLPAGPAPGFVVCQGAASAPCLPFTTSYTITAGDIGRPIGFTASTTTTGGGSLTFDCNASGTAGFVQFLVSGVAQALPGGKDTVCQVVQVRIIAPCLSISKLCDQPCFPYGSAITFHGVLSNNGNSDLSGIVATDNTGATLVFAGTTAQGHAYPDPIKGNFLVAGDSVGYTGSQPAANVCGPVTDTVSASATDEAGNPVTTSDPCVDLATCTANANPSQPTATCHVTTSPSLLLTKNCYKVGTEANPVKTLVPGESYVEVFTVKNTSIPPSPVNNVVIHDDVTGDHLCAATLAPGDTCTFTTTPRMITEADCAAGHITDTAYATAENPCAADQTCTNPASVTSNQVQCTITISCPPKIDITKKVACWLGTNPDGSDNCTAFGSSATGVAVGNNCPKFCYLITVVNSGPVGLVNVRVTDPSFVPPIDVTYPTLAAGESKEIKVSTTLCQDLKNTAMVNGTSAADSTQTVSGEATANAYVVTLTPSCVKQVSVDGGAFGTSADIPQDGAAHTVVYQVLVTNTQTPPVDVNHPAVALSVTVADSNPACVPAQTPTPVPSGQTVTIQLSTLQLTCPLANPGNTVTVTATAAPGAESPICHIGSNGLPVSGTTTCTATLNCKVQTCVSRTQGYWFNHVIPGAGSGCATLSAVFAQLPGNVMNLGFTTVNLNQALGYFWTKGKNANAGCAARQKAATQLIAAIANTTLLNAPGTCTTGTSLIASAQAALAGCNVAAINAIASQLDAFNNSGDNISFPAGPSACPVGTSNKAYIDANAAPIDTTICNCK